MPVTITCPYCRMTFTATCGTGTTCRNPECKAKISIDSNGKIKSNKPGKKKQCRNSKRNTGGKNGIFMQLR